jgi:hypothetical protein
MKFKTPAAMFTISYRTFFIRGFTRNPEYLLDMENKLSGNKPTAFLFRMDEAKKLNIFVICNMGFIVLLILPAGENEFSFKAATTGRI